MSNISKFINVLNTYLEVESFSPLVYNFPTNLNTCDSCCLDKSVLSYIDNGYLLRGMLTSKPISVAYMVSPKKKKGILLSSCFGYVLDSDIKVDPSLTFAEHAWTIIVEFLTSRAFKCMFESYTHFTVDANIPNELFTIRCSCKGISNFVSLRRSNGYPCIEVA